MKKIYINITILSTMEFEDEDDEEYIEAVVHERIRDCIDIDGPFNINDIEWSEG